MATNSFRVVTSLSFGLHSTVYTSLSFGLHSTVYTSFTEFARKFHVDRLQAILRQKLCKAETGIRKTRSLDGTLNISTFELVIHGIPRTSSGYSLLIPWIKTTWMTTCLERSNLPALPRERNKTPHPQDKATQFWPKVVSSVDSNWPPEMNLRTHCASVPTIRE
jgi:hypothetical protein